MPRYTKGDHVVETANPIDMNALRSSGYTESAARTDPTKTLDAVAKTRTETAKIRAEAAQRQELREQTERAREELADAKADLEEAKKADQDTPATQ